MKEAAQSINSFLFLFLATLVGSMWLSCASVHSEEPPAQNKSQLPSENDEYWTPERLREAKPLELPHPETPAPKATFPEPEGESSDTIAPSIEAPGDPGAGDVHPSEKNLLIGEGKTQ